MDAKEFKAKRMVEMLERIRGRHTELVTVYIPSGYNIQIKMNQLANEAGTAGNIQSKTVRTNVVTAIEKILTELRKVGATPPNGLAIFSGNISEVEGKPDYQIFMIEPPAPLKVNMYRCDNHFLVEPLKDIVGAKNTYGIITMDLRDAIVAKLKGQSINIIKKMESSVMGKFKAGGQSAGRFHRIRENQIKFFMKEVADVMAHSLKGPDIIGIIIGGPGPAKDELVKDYLNQEIQKKILTIQDVGHTDESGLRELIGKAHQILEKEEIVKEKAIMDSFLTHLAKDDGFSSYGKDEVKKNLEEASVEILLLSETLNEATIVEFSKIAENIGTDVHIISPDFQEGMQLQEMGGIAAILRFKRG